MGKTPLKQFTVWYQITASKAKLYLCPCIMSSGVLSTTNFYLSVLATTFGWSIEEMKTVFSTQAFVIIFISLADLRLQSGNIFYSQTFSSHRFQIIFSFPLFEAAIFWTITSANIKISRLFRKPPFYSYITICIHDSKPFAVSSTFPALPISFSIFLPRESPSLSLFHLRRGRILWFKL